VGRVRAMLLHDAAGIGAIMVSARPLRHRRSPAAVRWPEAARM